MTIANTDLLGKAIYLWTSSGNDPRILALQRKRRITVGSVPSRKTTHDQHMSDHYHHKYPPHHFRITQVKVKMVSRRSRSLVRPLTWSGKPKTRKVQGVVSALSCDDYSVYGPLGFLISHFLWIVVDWFLCVFMFFVGNCYLSPDLVSSFLIFPFVCSSLPHKQFLNVLLNAHTNVSRSFLSFTHLVLWIILP